MFNIPTCSPLNTLNNDNNNKAIPKSLAQLLADRRPSYSVSIPSESRKLNRECRRKGNEQVCGKDEEVNGGSIMLPLPPLKESNNAEIKKILLQKIQQCQQFVAWGEEENEEKINERLIKTNALEEVIEWVSNSSSKKMEEEDNLKRGLVDIVRILPPSETQDNSTTEELTDIGLDSRLTSNSHLEPNWPHLLQVYRLLHLLIEKWSDGDLAKFTEFNSKFIGDLLELFHSEDPRERQQLKKVVHTLYSKLVPLRPEIRKRMGWLFLEHVYESRQCKGVPEILEILGDIINGFCVPLKPEHRQFFLKILLPLHKPRTYLLYFAQLSNCVALFIEKDFSLVKPTFDYLLGKWPKDYSAKEVLLLTEIEEVLSRIGNNEFNLICKPLFRQLGKCASSLHFRVAERALQLWNSETILSLITPNYSHLLFPIMLPALFKANEANHWKNEINNLVYKSLMRLKRMDTTLFNLLTCDYNENENYLKIKKEENLFLIKKNEKHINYSNCSRQHLNEGNKEEVRGRWLLSDKDF
ncbi:unnamed protein product [Meloidogyne enterolobii]|uniref:Uncharacterized protein n=1 Tax=Meloidogyne enterolobii TaxID=390850 RepID=A0ACB1A2K4_MELEN